jgi:hypothetical protein
MKRNEEEEKRNEESKKFKINTKRHLEVHLSISSWSLFKEGHQGISFEGVAPFRM